MKSGTWKGADGTMYDVVDPLHVRADQARWWLNNIPEDGDVTLGPSTPNRLHNYPASMTGGARFALVLP